jgi:hypothetical protein
MIGLQINPYHAVAVYLGQPEASQQGFLYSPTLRLPPIQFYTANLIRVDDWRLVRISDGAEFVQDPDDWNSFLPVGGGRIHTYHGNDLLAPLEDGTYQAKITMTNGTIFWSHAICATRLFDAEAGTLSMVLDACTQTNGYYLDFVATGASYVEIYLEGVFQRTDGPAFRIGGSAEPIEVRNYTVILFADIEDSNGGRISAQRPYTITLTSNAACPSIVITPGTATLASGEELMYLEWWNDTDVIAQRILYQEHNDKSYRQRFYGKFWRQAPDPVLEQAFLVDKNGRQILQSATIGEGLNLECWPVPDYAFTVLANAGIHENRELSNMSGSPTLLDRLEFSSSPVGDSDMFKGQFACVVNLEYVGGCKEDFEEVA